jgi:hypothetical protein
VGAAAYIDRALLLDRRTFLERSERHADNFKSPSQAVKREGPDVIAAGADRGEVTLRAPAKSRSEPVSGGAGEAATASAAAPSGSTLCSVHR